MRMAGAVVLLLALAAGSPAPAQAPLSTSQLDGHYLPAPVQPYLLPQAPPPLVRSTAQIPSKALETIRFLTGPMVDPDEPLATGRISPRASRARTSRLIWAARLGEKYYLIHWERPLQDDVVRQLSIVQFGPTGLASLAWEARFACEPFDETLRLNRTCPEPTRLPDFRALQAMLSKPYVLIAGRTGPIVTEPVGLADPLIPQAVKAAMLAARNPTLVRDAAALPPEILALLRPVISRQLDRPLSEVIAAPEESFNAIDVFDLSRPLPSSRMIWGTRVGAYYVLHWERGGVMGGPYGMVHIYRYDAAGRPRMIWTGHRPAKIEDPRRRMTDFATFQAALAGEEIQTIGAGANCNHALGAPPRITRLLIGREQAAPTVRKVAQLPAGALALLPAHTNPSTMRDADQPLPTPTAIGPMATRLMWAGRIGGTWFAQQEHLVWAGQGPDPKMIFMGTPGIQRTYSIAVFETGPDGLRLAVNLGGGPYPSLEALRETARGVTPLDLAEMLEANNCAVR